MHKVDSTQRNTGARWWLGPLGILLIGVAADPLAATILGAFFTGFLVWRHAPRRDVVAMAVVTMVASALFLLATAGYWNEFLPSFNDWTRFRD